MNGLCDGAGVVEGGEAPEFTAAYETANKPSRRMADMLATMQTEGTQERPRLRLERSWMASFEPARRRRKTEPV